MNFGLIGLPVGLVRYVSKFEKDDDWEKIYDMLKTVLIIIILFGIFLALLTILFSKPLSEVLLNTPDYYFLIVLTGLSIPFTFVYWTFDSYLRGLKKFGDYVAVGIAVIVSGLIITVILVYFYNLEGVAFGIFVSSFVGLLLYIFYFLKKKLIDFRRLFNANLDFSLFKKILSIGIGSLLIGVISQLSIIIVRTGIINNLGFEANGIYQAVYGISNNYFGPIGMMMGIYSIPILSEISTDKELVNQEINTTIRFISLLIIPILLTTFVFREQIILILYSPEFIEATDLFPFIVAGDFFKSYAWIIGLWLVPCKKIKAWVLFELIFNVNLILLFYIFLFFFHFSLHSIAIAYFISNVLHLVINYLYIRQSNSFRLMPGISKAMIISFIIFSVVLVVSSISYVYGYFIFIPALIGWGLLVIEKSEFTEIMVKIKSYFNKNEING